MTGQVVKLAQFDNGKGLAFLDAVAEANRQKLRLLNNLEIGARLQGSQWEQEKEMYPCRTGTLMAYSEPGEQLGEAIEFQGRIERVKP